MRPFVILALPRTGTTLLVEALSAHPEIPNVIHEFRGGLWRFIKHPYVLSNYRKWWMRLPFITKIHYYREDAIAGAKSMLLMHYQFPPGAATLPIDEVLKLAKKRKQWDERFRKIADYTITYEGLTNGKEIDLFPEKLSRWLCDILKVGQWAFCTTHVKSRKGALKNESEVQCLRV